MAIRKERMNDDPSVAPPLASLTRPELRKRKRPMPERQSSFIDRKPDLKRYEPTEKMKAQLKNFSFPKPVGDQAARSRALCAEFRHLAESVLLMTPPGREQSLAMTALEEAAMWSCSAIRNREEGLIDDEPR